MFFIWSLTSGIGAITDTQYSSALKNGRLTPEAKTDLRKILTHMILNGGVDKLGDMFEKLPVASQNGLIESIAAFAQVPEGSNIVPDIQKAIELYSELMNSSAYKDFVNAKTFEEALNAVRSAFSQMLIGQPSLGERFADEQAVIAAMLKTETKNSIKAIFKEYSRLTNGGEGSEGDMFSSDNGKKYTKAEAIEKIFNIKLKGKENGKREEQKTELSNASDSEREEELERRGRQTNDGRGDSTEGQGNVEGNNPQTFEQAVEADTTQKTTIEGSQESVPKEGKWKKTISEDEQGNPVDANGKLIIDKVKSIDEIGDDDFENPKRNIQLPSLPNNVADAIGSTGKPVIIKKNIFKKNAEVHLDLEPEDSRKILTEALYNTNMYGATQPITRPDYRVAIHTGDSNSIVILDIYKGKENVEIVGWRRIDARGLEKMKRQAEREGGQILILSPENGSAAALSALPPTTSSEGKDTNNNDTTRKDNEDLSIINNPTNSSISETELNNAKNGRIIPDDVEKDVSSRIENDFDRKIEDELKYLGVKDNGVLNKELDDFVKEFSMARRSVLETERQDAKDFLKQHYNYDLDSRRYVSDEGTGRSSGERVREKESETGGFGATVDEVRQRLIVHAIDRELAYRDERVKQISEELGIKADEPITYAKTESIFKGIISDRQAQDLFDKVIALNKKLGVSLGIKSESERGALGGTTTNRSINYYIDGYVRTNSSRLDLAVSIGHEMLHQCVMGAIDLVKKGKAESLLTEKQIGAVNTILDIYDKVKNNKERFKEETYGLSDVQELAAQMVDPRQRKAMSLSILDRVINAANILRSSGDISVWNRIKNALKALFEVSDKEKMDRAIEDIMADFNEAVHDIAMNGIDTEGFGYKISANDKDLTEDDKRAIDKLIEKLDRLDGKGTVIENENQLDAEGRRALAVNPKATGWYDTRTGKVVIYLPNCKSIAEAEKTILHEKVGHEGLRKFFGEKGYRNFMSDVFMHGDKEMKQWVLEYVQRHGWNLYEAIDEYYANKAEEPATYNTWEKVHNSFSNALIKLGFRTPTINDTRYIMWLSKNYVKSGIDSPMDIARRNAFLNKMNANPILKSVTPDKTRYSNTGNTLFRSAETGDTEGRKNQNKH